MKQPYESPELVDYGQIAACTFTHPRRHPRHPRGWGHYGEDDGGLVPSVVAT